MPIVIRDADLAYRNNSPFSIERIRESFESGKMLLRPGKKTVWRGLNLTTYGPSPCALDFGNRMEISKVHTANPRIWNSPRRKKSKGSKESSAFLNTYEKYYMLARSIVDYCEDRPVSKQLSHDLIEHPHLRDHFRRYHDGGREELLDSANAWLDKYGVVFDTPMILLKVYTGHDPEVSVLFSMYMRSHENTLGLFLTSDGTLVEAPLSFVSSLGPLHTQSDNKFQIGNSVFTPDECAPFFVKLGVKFNDLGRAIHDYLSFIRNMYV
jgi:hypothetical protein